MAAADYLYRRFSMPRTGKLLEVRKVREGARPEATVREVNDNDELSPHEYCVQLAFLLRHGTLVPKLGAKRARKAVAHG